MSKRLACAVPLLLSLAVPLAAAPLSVTGSVAQPGGAPLAGARVSLAPLPGSHAWGALVLQGRTVPEPVATATADAAGRFRLDAPEAGLWTLVAEAPGRVPVQASPLVLVEPVELPPAILPEDTGLRLRVTGAEGQPAVDVQVWATGEAPAVWKETDAWGWAPQPRFARTGADGTVVLPRVVRERMTVRFFLNGREILRRQALEGGTVALPAAAGSPRTIEVRGRDGRLVAGVQVRVGDVPLPAAATGPDGRALVTFPPAGAGLRLLAPDGRRLAVSQLPPPASDGAPFVIPLPEPVLLEGKVLDAVTRRPLAGAVVWLSADPGAFVRTDARGVYRIAPIEGETPQLRAEAAGHLPLARRLGWVRGGPARAPSLTLDPAASAAGIVVDAAGKPLAGARVQAVLRSAPRQRTFSRSGDPERNAVTGVDGRFRLTGLLAGGTTWEVRALLPGHAPARLTLTRLSAGSARGDLRLVLGPGRTGVGRVLDRAEKPVAGAEVTLVATTGESAPGGADAADRRRVTEEGIDLWKAVSDPAGRFTIAGLPAGRADLRVARPGYVPVTVRALAVPGGAGPFDLGTVILEPGVEVRGLVVDREGKPIDKAEIHAGKDLRRLRFLAESGQPPGRRPDATTGTDGRFVLSDLRRGDKVELWVGAPGFLPVPVDAVTAPNEKPVRVVLERGARVAGRVVDAEGNPVAGAELSLEMERPGEERGLIRFAGGRRATARSEADGRFAFPPLPPGRGHLLASADGFQPVERKELTLPAGGIEGLELVLERGAVIEGRVLTAGGEPVEDARVVCDAAASVSDADGAYRLDGIPPGPRTVRLLHREYPPLDKELNVEPGVNLLDLVLPEGREVAGRVVDRDGRPVAGADLAIYLEGSPREQAAVSGDDGGFSFPRVADGVYTLRAGREGYRTVETAGAVTVAGAPVRDLEVRLERGTRIHGRLLGLDLYDLSEVEVRAAREDGSGERPGRVDYEGGYEIPDLGTGDWIVTGTLRNGTREARGRAFIEPATEEVKIDLEFGRALTLTGRVIYGREPLAGADLSLRGLDVSGFRSVTTDVEGAFRVEDLRPGNYRVQVVSQREILNHAEDLRLDADRDITLEIAAARVAGTVVDGPSGSPVDGAVVGLRRLAGGGEAAFLIAIGTDAEGEFALPAVTEGRYRMTINKDGYTPYERELDISATAALEDLRIPLEPAAGLDLDVRLAAGGRPDHVRAAVLDASGRMVLFEVRAPDAAGRIRLPNLAPGAWEILLLAPGSAPATVRARVPSPEAVPVVLPPGGRLTVRIPSLAAADQVASLVLVDAEGAPFRAPTPYGTVETQWAIDGGKGVVEGVPAGTWVLRAAAPDGRSWERTVATAGADAEVGLE